MKQLEIIKPYPVHKASGDTVILRAGEVYDLDNRLADRLIKLGVGKRLKRKEFWEVLPVWHGDSCVILGGGPSLTQEQVNSCRHKVKVITINDGYKLAPWADILYLCDNRWYDLHQEAVDNFKGTRIKLHPGVTNRDILILRNGDNDSPHKRLGFELERKDTLKTGRNSGFQALNLALHLGAKRIGLLGYDMKLGPQGETHWFGDHPWKMRETIFESSFLEWFRKPEVGEQLANLQVEVINCTPHSALKVFPSLDLEEFLNLP